MFLDFCRKRFHAEVTTNSIRNIDDKKEFENKKIYLKYYHDPSSSSSSSSSSQNQELNKSKNNTNIIMTDDDITSASSTAFFPTTTTTVLAPKFYDKDLSPRSSLQNMWNRIISQNRYVEYLENKLKNINISMLKEQNDYKTNYKNLQIQIQDIKNKHESTLKQEIHQLHNYYDSSLNEKNKKIQQLISEKDLLTKEKEENILCVVCFERNRNTFFWNCRHFVICSQCASKCNSVCPMCKSKSIYIQCFL